MTGTGPRPSRDVTRPGSALFSSVYVTRTAGDVTAGSDVARLAFVKLPRPMGDVNPRREAPISARVPPLMLLAAHRLPFDAVTNGMDGRRATRDASRPVGERGDAEGACVTGVGAAAVVGR
ncbi:unnamed protein product [Lampetra planeri]